MITIKQMVIVKEYKMLKDLFDDDILRNGVDRRAMSDLMVTSVTIYDMHNFRIDVSMSREFIEEDGIPMVLTVLEAKLERTS